MTTPSQTFSTDLSYGSDTALRIISGKWKPLILFFLRDGPKRYGELKRLVRGVSDKVLIQQLKDLEANHVLTRTDYKEVPPRVDYALTPLGRSLSDAIVPLCTWQAEHTAEMASIVAKRDTLP
ncbi:helix-turn-helix domain-containing protein [Phenylobacterium sp.]|uniref:winged helix-turn-helix transcriptional regulator n=1 Tax=Phenylobacterium sp. TaxID=1871053 RepID=UPI0027315C72|nr:helix-turn-helix domain-containing protein [Phenylobacterium sp.]MDP1597952.1 helix-turn-helix domain-containing protein [Phenylobacterium sp.]MDP3592788.1 helix-turn-helix domain-containing protein [Phenylobacterium sp.]